MGVIEVTGTLQPNDYVRAQFLHLRPRPAYKVLGVVILVAYFWAGWLSFSKDDIGVMDYLYVALILFLVLNFAVYLPWNARRVFKQQKDLQRELTYRFDESGVFASNEKAESTTLWEDYLKLKHSDQMILLYLSDCMYHMIPKTLFDRPGDFDELKKMAGNMIGRGEG